MKPVIHETAFVADNATVRGNVTIGEGAGIYFGAVLRADQTRAVFLAEPVADVIAVTGTVILFTLQFRKALRKLESENKT